MAVGSRRDAPLTWIATSGASGAAGAQAQRRANRQWIVARTSILMAVTAALALIVGVVAGRRLVGAFLNWLRRPCSL